MTEKDLADLRALAAWLKTVVLDCHGFDACDNEGRKPDEHAVTLFVGVEARNGVTHPVTGSIADIDAKIKRGAALVQVVLDERDQAAEVLRTLRSSLDKAAAENDALRVRVAEQDAAVLALREQVDPVAFAKVSVERVAAFDRIKAEREVAIQANERLLLKADLNHDMLRPFYWQCERCGGVGRNLTPFDGPVEVVPCEACKGSGFVGPKGKFLPEDKHEPDARNVWVAGFTAPTGSLALRLATGEAEWHGVRIAYDGAEELAEAAKAALLEHDQDRHGEITRQARERLGKAIDEVGH